MTETLWAKHIERDGIGMCGRLIAEHKLRLRVDEAPDQPGGRNPIDAGTRPGNPQTVYVIACLSCASACRLGRLYLVDAIQQTFKPSPRWAPEEVDVLQLQKPATKAIQTAGRPSRQRHCQYLLRFMQQLLIVVSSGFEKTLFQLPRRQVVEALCLNYRGLSLVYT